MPIVQLEIKGRFPAMSVETRNVFHISGPDIGPDQAGGTIAAIRTAFDQHVKALWGVGYELYGASWRNISVGGLGGVDVAFATLAGTNASGDLLPPQVAALISFRTGTAAPKQGRKYLTGFTEMAQAAGRWTPATVTSLQAFANALLNIGSGAGSDRPLGVARVDPATGIGTDWNPYSVAIARDVTATMRSRRIGQGI
jgi:hypothetical protein